MLVAAGAPGPKCQYTIQFLPYEGKHSLSPQLLFHTFALLLQTCFVGNAFLRCSMAWSDFACLRQLIDMSM